jgi:PEGA domain
MSRARILFAAVALILLAPSAARAGEASALLEKGIASFGLGQLEASRLALEQARAAAKAPKLLGKIQLYLGLNAAVAGQNGRASEAFAAALRHDPTLLMDATSFKPDLVALFESVRKRTPGELRISLAAPGATVLVNGRSQGSLPLSLKLPVGKHTVEVRSADGLASFRSEVVVLAGLPTQLAAHLEPKQGKLKIRTSPGGAEVLLDGEAIGRTPLDRQVAAGKHVVALQVEGHAPLMKRIEVKPGEDTRLALNLTPLASGPGAAREPNFFTRRLWTWVAAGTALAALGAGIGVGVSANADYEEYELSCNEAHNYCSELGDRVDTKDRVANAMFGVAGAAAAAAVVLYFVEGRASTQGHEKRASGASRVRALVGPTGGTLRVSF